MSSEPGRSDSSYLDALRASKEMVELENRIRDTQTPE